MEAERDRCGVAATNGAAIAPAGVATTCAIERRGIEEAGDADADEDAVEDEIEVVVEVGVEDVVEDAVEVEVLVEVVVEVVVEDAVEVVVEVEDAGADGFWKMPWRRGGAATAAADAAAAAFAAAAATSSKLMAAPWSTKLWKSGDSWPISAGGDVSKRLVS